MLKMLLAFKLNFNGVDLREKYQICFFLKVEKIRIKLEKDS